MRMATVLKLAQVVGALAMAAGVASCMMAERGSDRSTAWLFILGAALYGGGRLAMWLRARDE